MSEKAALKELLRNLGFASLTGSTFYAEVGDLYHVIGVAKDRRLDGWQIDIGIWHPSFSESGSKPNLLTPLVAMVAPDGAIDSWTWKAGSVDAHQIERVISGFFSGFLRFDDMAICMEGRWNWPPENRGLSVPLEAIELNNGPTSPRYPVVGGMTAIKVRTRRLASFLQSVCGPLGFSTTSADPLVVQRKRGAVWDCVAFRLDKFGTLAAISIFHWLPELWRVEPRLKGTYHPLNGSFLKEETGRVLLINCVTTEPVAPVSELRDAIDMAVTTESSRVVDIFSFCATVHEEYEPIARKLLTVQSKSGGV